MAERATGGTAGAAGRAPAVDRPDMVRNVVLVGHSGAGKTTLVEALLAATGTIQRHRPGRGRHDGQRLRRGRGAPAALGEPVPGSDDHNGIKINLLDTPGYADFVGDLRAGLRAADAALFVVSAVEGIDGLTRMLWEECAAVGMPRAVVITKIDHQRANFDEVAHRLPGRLRRRRGSRCYLPVVTNGRVNGLIGLLSQKFFDYSTGSRTEHDPGPTYLDQIEEQRGALIEGIIQESEDESLMDRYLSGEEIDTKVLIEDLEKAVARGRLLPGARLPRTPAWASAWRGARSHHPGLPLPAGAPRCRRSPPLDGKPGRRPSPATPTGRWWPRSSRPPPTRTSAGSAWSGCSPARCART